ncbi:MAG: biotin/lipoyl-containing protein, partial [Candidatus Binataceae bacterium]
MKLKRTDDSREFDVEILAREGTSVRARIDGEEITVEVTAMPDGSALFSRGSRRVRVFGARNRRAIMVAAGPLAYELVEVEARRGRGAHGLTTPEVTAPMPGKVLKVLVSEGQQVAAGEPLIVLEAMKMETTLSAESPALVKKIHARAGQMIDHGAVLIELSPAPA